ncbi:protein of unknown function DUF461 [Actinobacteria bacterium OK074]|nr:protein of unknown function DUF461 [Actinobacteria bacterium OK074]
MSLRRCAFVLTAGLVLAGCGGGSGSAKPEVKVSGAYMPAPPTADLAAGYLVVTDSGGADTLTSVTSADAKTVTMHSTKGGEMTEETSFAVPADGTLTFASGGNHLMFENLARKPAQGENVSVELHFAKSGTVKVEMPVKSPTYNPKTGH